MSPHITYFQGTTDTTTTDTTDSRGEGITEHNISNQVEAATDEAIDEAIKSETEKLYEEACSIVSSTGGIVALHISCTFFKGDRNLWIQLCFACLIVCMILI